MNCERIEELLSLYLEGALSPKEKNAVEKHLDSCSACAQLLDALRDTCRALASIPELEVSPGLLSRLAAIPKTKKKVRFSLDFLLRPSLQPAFALAAVGLTLLSFYLFHPDKKKIDRTIEQQFHLGLSWVEKIYVRAGAFSDRLSDQAGNLVVSVKNLKIFERNEDQAF